MPVLAQMHLLKTLTSLAAVWKTCSTMQDHFASRRAKMEEDPSKVPEIPGEDHAEFREVFVNRHPDVLLVQRDFLVGWDQDAHWADCAKDRALQECRGSVESGYGWSTSCRKLWVTSDGRAACILHHARVPQHLRVLPRCRTMALSGGARRVAPWESRAGSFCSQLTLWSARRCIGSAQTSGRSLPTSQLRSGRCSPITSSSGMMPGPVQSWTSSNKLCRPQLQRPQFPRRGNVRHRVHHQRALRRPRRTRRAALARSSISRKQELPWLRQRGDKHASSKKPSRDERVPAKEWQSITAFKYSGPRRCPFYNCSLGCRFWWSVQTEACVCRVWAKRLLPVRRMSMSRGCSQRPMMRDRASGGNWRWKWPAPKRTSKAREQRWHVTASAPAKGSRSTARFTYCGPIPSSGRNDCAPRA